MSAIHSPSFQHVIKLGAKLKMSLNLLFFILFFPPKKFEGFFVFKAKEKLDMFVPTRSQQLTIMSRKIYLFLWVEESYIRHDV